MPIFRGIRNSRALLLTFKSREKTGEEGGFRGNEHSKSPKQAKNHIKWFDVFRYQYLDTEQDQAAYMETDTAN